MIHPGAHHNKQLAHAATGRDIKFHAGCAVIYAATHARELIWCTPDILSRAAQKPTVFVHLNS